METYPAERRVTIFSAPRAAVFLDGVSISQALEPTHLQHGQHVVIGEHSFVVRFEEGNESPTAVATAGRAEHGHGQRFAAIGGTGAEAAAGPPTINLLDAAQTPAVERATLNNASNGAFVGRGDDGALYRAADGGLYRAADEGSSNGRALPNGRRGHFYAGGATPQGKSREAVAENQVLMARAAATQVRSALG